jgi:DnaJ-like protein
VAVARERVEDVRRVLRRDVPLRQRMPGAARRLAAEFRPNEGLLAIAATATGRGLLAATNQRLVHVTRGEQPTTWEIRDLAAHAPLPADLALHPIDARRLTAAVRSTVLWHQRAARRRPAQENARTPAALTDLLGLPRDASDDAVRDAYRVLSQIFHPDRHAGAPAAVRDEAARRMRDLNVAYSAWRARAAA